jgi:AraC family transcriptional regulator of adaptative response/methylated-DNA-[protein]-cysteine methyltransferase
MTAEIGNNQTVYYWVEPVKIGNERRELFTAVCSSGLVMSSLGNKEELLDELQAKLRRYLPGFVLAESKEPNREAIKQFKEYFSGLRRQFSIPLLQLGTPFQLEVWRQLQKIPYGETRSYSDIGGAVGCPRGQRAVGQANNKNHLGIIVPCHRVIGKNGDLTGYAGGLEIKRMLLELEKKYRTI